MTELVLSASSVEAYRSCHWRWFLQYVEAHAGEQSIEAAVGLAVHAGVEHYYKARLGEYGEKIDPVDTGLESYELTYATEALSIADVDPKMRAIGRRVYQAYVEDVGSATIPVLVEHAGTMTVNGISYSYHIDLADDQRVVRDTKVKKAKPRDPGRYAFAMTGYSLAYRADTGTIERDVQLDVMIRLKRDRPYHVPISNGGPMSDHDIGIFARQLEDVANGIERADFEPTGLARGECRYCPVRSICDYYKALSEEAPGADEDDKWYAQGGNDAAGHAEWD